jgi:hypothetical protein
MIRPLSFVAGAAVLLATAHVTISYAGGYGTPHAVLTLAIAGGVIVAALVIGAAWSAKRRPLAAWLLVAIVAGEAFGFLATGERLVAQRDATQAPLRTAQEAFDKAADRVAKAESARAAIPATTPRLEAAVAAKKNADAAVVQRAAERNCLANCRALLQSQVDAASHEVDAARTELANQVRTTDTELTTARTNLAGMKPPASATPLADRVGLPAWLIDVIAAALGAVASNGLGVGLIAFAAHARPTTHARSMGSPAVPDAEHAAHFALETLKPAPDEAADLLAVFRAYVSWCSAREVRPLSEAKFGAALATVFDRAGVPVVEREGHILAMGVGIASAPALIAAPR